MLVAGHNAHLLKVTSPPVVADAELGIAAQGEQILWQGDAQAQVIIENQEVVRGGTSPQGAQERVQILTLVAQLPTNLPYQIKQGDLLHFKIRNVIGYGQRWQKAQVRWIDQTYWGVSYVKVTCRPL